MTTPIVFLDTETTGLHAGREAWDIAIIRRTGDTQTTWQFFVDVDLSHAEPMGLKIGGFYQRHPYGRYLAGRLPHPFADDFRRDRGEAGGTLVTSVEAAALVARLTHGAHIVGAVPSFDTDTLAGLLRRHGLTPAWHYHLIDVEAMAVGYLHVRAPLAGVDKSLLPLTPPWKSDDLSRACGVEPPADHERHTALGDATWAMRLYDTITEGTAS
jgi:hypothetical protein